MPANSALVEYLKTRRSVTLPFLKEPGPSEDELQAMFEIAIRVPDHGKLAPWRMLVYSGEARRKAGEKVAEIARANNPEMIEDMLEAERNQFLPAPVTVGVISTAAEHVKIPQVEQLLSAGCVAFNLVHAANAFGYGAHWVTRWFAYDQAAARALGAGEGERFVGFVHIGTPEARLEERDRPPVGDVVREWQG